MAQLSRLFFGADLPDEARTDLAHLIELWAPIGLPGRVVPPQNWHITLRFLGESDDVGQDRVVAGLDALMAGGSFRIDLAGIGAFPRPARATVLWIGVGRGSERLTDMAALAEEAALGAGFDPEDRPFSPHLTLSRIRPNQDLRPLLERPLPGRVGFELTALTLFRSHLGSGGANYEVIETFPLD